MGEQQSVKFLPGAISETEDSKARTEKAEGKVGIEALPKVSGSIQVLVNKNLVKKDAAQFNQLMTSRVQFVTAMNALTTSLVGQPAVTQQQHKPQLGPR
jgi:hypothetical protein